jgi:N-acyl-D-amino-acid deacylase
VPIAAMVAALALGGVGCAPSDDYDVLITGGTLFDGSGEPGSVGDLAMKDGRIVAIGDVEGSAELTIDAEGLYVTPGFFDMHSHSESARLSHGGQGPSFALQGITTEIYGETSSMGPVGGLRRGSEERWTTLGEFLDYMEEMGMAANFGSYVGSGGVRAMVIGYDDREPTAEELEQMRAIVEEAMRDGALGVSSGMSYVPNIYMSTAELTTLVSAAAPFGGIYATHARTMNGTDPNAIREAIEIARGAGVPLHFFHLNSTSSTRADEFLAIIDEARAEGMQVTGDSYAYTWGITGLSSYIPAWAQEGGRQAMLERLRDPEQRARIAAGFVDEPPYLANIGWHHIRLGVRDPEVNGKLVSEVAELRGQPPEEVFMDIVLEQEGSGIVIDWNNEEETLQQVLAQPFVAGGTDGGALGLDWDDQPPLVHPRHLGTFPRWFGTYVEEVRLFTWEEGVRKLTSLPASILGLEDRGRLEEGYFADVLVIDPRSIRGVATFEDPFHYAQGMRFVFVNGEAVVAEGELTGALPGRAIRGKGWSPDSGTRQRSE